MKNSPAFQFYAADFEMATSTWELDEVGLYIKLLIHQWTNGPLPNDYKKLAKIARISPKKFSNLFQIVSKKFPLDSSGRLANIRLEKVRQNQINYRKKQTDFGKKGAEKRWGN